MMQIPDDIMQIARLCTTDREIATAILFERQAHEHAVPSAPDFRTDIEAAKTGDPVILAITGPLTKQMVLRSYWIPAEERFNFLDKDKNVVIGWMPWPEFPEHLLWRTADSASSPRF